MRQQVVQALALLIALCGIASTPAAGESFALVNGHVFDGVKEAILEDVVVLVRDGRVRAVGSHWELLASSEDYRDLVETQLIGEEAPAALRPGSSPFVAAGDAA